MVRRSVSARSIPLIRIPHCIHAYDTLDVCRQARTIFTILQARLELPMAPSGKKTLTGLARTCG